MKRIIPATMSTQHPDNASAAFWCNKSFINTADEIEEAYIAFSDLGCEEYMWDWEGKFVDEAVIDKLFRKYTQYFQKNPLGQKKFLTYRIPNIWEEHGYRLARAFMNIVTSADLAKEAGFHTPPIMEVILPMTKNADQIFETDSLFRKVAKLKCEIFDSKKQCDFSHIDVIPLVEQVADLTSVNVLLEEYLKKYKKAYKKYPTLMRPFIARSDPALNAGIVPSVLASKVAISHFYNVQEKYGVPMYPIIGTGSLPFRGGVNPENIEEVIQEYRGIRTVTVQSAFKYDYPEVQVRAALKYIQDTLPKMKPDFLSPKEVAEIVKVNAFFAEMYQKTVEPLAPFINKVAASIPPRRERMQHIGLFGYSRGIGKVSLPRAITFTGSFYSLGVPPEFIGTGRALRRAKKEGYLPLIERLYINLRRDLTHAGKYLNRENLEFLAKKHPSFKEIAEDVRAVEEVLGIALGPIRDAHFLHRNLVSNIYHKMEIGMDAAEDVVQAGIIRKSLG
ncbi:MAG: phosphoenolpyruvate carboxylase [Patescibacteria group bacterium]